MANDNPRARLAELKERWDADRSSRLFLQLAEEYRRQGMPTEALGVLEEGLKVHPPTGAAQVVLGRCQLDAGEVPAAIDTLEQVILRDPTQMVAYRALVDAYIQKRDADKAKDRLGLYAQLNPQDPEIEELSQRIERLDLALEPDPQEESTGATDVEPQEEAPELSGESSLPAPPAAGLDPLSDLDPGATVQIPSLSPEEAEALVTANAPTEDTGEDYKIPEQDLQAEQATTETVDLPAVDDLEPAGFTPSVPDLPVIPEVPEFPEASEIAEASDIPEADDLAPQLPKSGEDTAMRGDGIPSAAEPTSLDAGETAAESPDHEASLSSAVTPPDDVEVATDRAQELQESWGRRPGDFTPKPEESSASDPGDEPSGDVSETQDVAEDDDQAPVPWSLPDAIAAEAASLDAPELPAANLKVFGAVADDVVAAETEDSASETVDLPPADADPQAVESEAGSVSEPHDGPSEVDGPFEVTEEEPEADIQDEAEVVPEIAEALSTPPQEVPDALNVEPEDDAKSSGAGLAAATGLFGSLGLGWAAKNATSGSEEDAAQRTEDEVESEAQLHGGSDPEPELPKLPAESFEADIPSDVSASELSVAAPTEDDASEERAAEDDASEEWAAEDSAAEDSVAEDSAAEDTVAEGLAAEGDSAESDSILDPTSDDEMQPEAWVAPALGVALAEGGNGVVFVLDPERLPPQANLELVPTRPLRQRSLAEPKMVVAAPVASQDSPGEVSVGDPVEPNASSGAGVDAAAVTAVVGGTAATATLANLYREQGHTEDAVRVMSSVRSDPDPVVTASDLLSDAEDGAGLSTRKAAMLRAYLERLGKGV